MTHQSTLSGVVSHYSLRHGDTVANQMLDIFGLSINLLLSEKFLPKLSKREGWNGG